MTIWIISLILAATKLIIYGHNRISSLFYFIFESESVIDTQICTKS